MKNVLVLVSIVFLMFGFTPVWGDSLEVEAQIAELEARMDQLEKRTAVPTVHSHDSHGHDGHHHAAVALSDLELHAGMDLRYLQVQDSPSNIFIHEVELGLGANLSKNVYGLVKLAQHYGEGTEVHDAYLIYGMDKLSLLAGKTRVKFGLENNYCFYSRRTITPSAIGGIIFSNHGWSDIGIAVSVAPSFGNTKLNFSVLRGNPEEGIFSTGTAESNDTYPVVVDFVSNFGPIRAGASYSSGRWDAAGLYNVDVLGANATYVNGSFEIVGELISAAKQTSTGYIYPQGYYLLGIMKPNEKTELLLSYGIGDDGAGSKEIRIGFQPTLMLADNAKLRAIYEIRQEEPVTSANNRLIVQLAFEI